MSEADTPQNFNQYQSPPEPIVPIDISAIDVTAIEPENEPEQQLESEDTVRSAQPEQIVEVAAAITADATDGETTAPSLLPATSTTNVTAIGVVAPMPASETNLVALVQKLRQRNRNLVNRVNQLEQALGESQEALQSQKARTQSQDTILARASQEIAAAGEQMTRLFHELESSHQVAQRQQILIETLTEQLESSQERMAQMERECALTQQRYNEQSHQLLQTENTSRELRDRLQRQQRHTLQFKAALEKCLEVPAINYEANTDALNSSVVTWSQTHLKSILATPSVLPKAQPIQPWSAQPELLEDSSGLESSEDNFAPEFSDRNSDEQSSFIGHWSRANDEAQRTCPPPPPTPLPFRDRGEGQMMAIDLNFQSDAEEIPALGTHEVAGDWFSDTAMTATEQEMQPQSWQEALPELVWLSELLEEPEEDLPASAIVNAGDRALQPSINEDSQNLETQNFASLPIHGVPPTDPTEAEVAMQRGDLAQNSATDTQNTPHPQAILSQPNWPSPVVYPLRPSRGRKSLAAVELPSFPRKDANSEE